MTLPAVDQWLALAGEHFRNRRLPEAEALYRRILVDRPADERALEPLGFVLSQLGRPADALAQFEKALAANPRLPVSHIAAGYVLLELGRGEAALGHFDAALKLRPLDVDALKGRGIALARANRHAEAIENYKAAQSAAPGDAEIHYNLGNSLLASGRAPAAIDAYDGALARRPQFAEALNNRGAALRALDRPEEALACFLQALRIRSNLPDALQNVGDLLCRTGQYTEAVGAYEQALRAQPDYPYTEGAALLARLTCCDWEDYEQRAARVLEGISSGKRVAVPLLASLISADPGHSLHCARTWVNDRLPAAGEPLWRGERYGHERIRLAYLSADFREHPVAYALAGVLERHDRSRFETIAVSFRANRGPSAMRARLEKAVDRFIDVADRGDLDIARLLRELEVDIAVDLMGHTEDSRTGVFAFRPAPVQVSYLGYPATLGASYIDYLLADEIAVPTASHSSYSERVFNLSNSYLPGDHAQLAAVEMPTRAAAGLPEGAFVLCGFNNTSKITPTVFGIWMRLLQRIEGSVLWLSARNAVAAQNLRAQAQRHAVDARRLIFAPRVQSLEEHLARHRQADLFVDTFPYNAHTTAMDALWAGVPVVTCAGETMASRAGASLLTAMGLESLITHSLADYKEKVLTLAGDPAKLAEVRHRLAANRVTSPLFDTERSRRDLERAYLEMWGRSQAG